METLVGWIFRAVLHPTCCEIPPDFVIQQIRACPCDAGCRRSHVGIGCSRNLFERPPVGRYRGGVKLFFAWIFMLFGVIVYFPWSGLSWYKAPVLRNLSVSIDMFLTCSSHMSFFRGGKCRSFTKTWLLDVPHVCVYIYIYIHTGMSWWKLVHV